MIDLEQLPMPACIIDGARIVALNGDLERLLGYGRAELLASENAMQSFLAVSDIARVSERHAARLRGDASPADYALLLRHRSGREIPARIRIARHPGMGPDAVLCLFSDEGERERSSSLIRGFVDCAMEATAQSSAAEILRVAVERLEKLGLWATLIEVEDGRFRVLSSNVSPLVKLLRERFPGWAPSNLFDAGPHSESGAFLDDLPGLYAQALGISRAELPETPRQAMVAGVSQGDKHWVISCSGDGLDKSVATAFGLLGKQLGAAIETARRIAETRARNAELESLLQLGAEVTGALDLQAVMRAAARTAARTVRCSCAYVLLPDGDGLVVADREDPLEPPEAAKGARLPFSQPSLSALAFRTGQPQSSIDNQTDARVDPEVRRRFLCSATLAVPLLARGRTLGVLALFERSGRAFDAQDTRLAVHAAQLISTALDNARLYDELRKSYADLARAQAELIDRERLAALGELSASIAHEVRNPLGVMFNSVGTLRRLLRPKDEIAMLLDIIGEEADRLNRMVGDLLDYSRPLQPALQPISLAALLDEALGSARQLVGAPADAVLSELSVAQGCETLRADARLLRQALVNLLLNAFQAMPKGGRLSVEARLGRLGLAACAEISVRDSGAGVSSEARPRIFQPFFTTKATGTGLGLAVVRRIVEGHGGEVALGRPQSGAEFLLRLPLPGPPARW